MREGARGCVASREATRGGGGSQAGRRWPGRVAARAGRVPVLLAREEGDRGVAVAAGPASCSAGPVWLPGERQVAPAPFFLIFCSVLFLFNSFATVLNLK